MINPNVAKAGVIQNQGAKGAAVVIYCNPWATPDMDGSGFPVGEQHEKIIVFPATHIWCIPIKPGYCFDLSMFSNRYNDFSMLLCNYGVNYTKLGRQLQNMRTRRVVYVFMSPFSIDAGEPAEQPTDRKAPRRLVP